MTIVPDKITPEVGWRVWRLPSVTGYLTAVHTKATVWKPGEPLHAACFADRQPPRAWCPVSIEEAVGGDEKTHFDWLRHGSDRAEIRQRPPKTRLPENMAYVWRELPDPHQPPVKECTCGVYATADIYGCVDQLQYGSVIGRVALWGSVIPGEKGFRAEFAYPIDLFVRSGAVKDFPKKQEPGMLWTTMFWNAIAEDAQLPQQQAQKAADHLSKRYGVPCRSFSEFSSVAEIA